MDELTRTGTHTNEALRARGHRAEFLGALSHSRPAEPFQGGIFRILYVPKQRLDVVGYKCSLPGDCITVLGGIEVWFVGNRRGVSRPYEAPPAALDDSHLPQLHSLREIFPRFLAARSVCAL